MNEGNYTPMNLLLTAAAAGNGKKAGQWGPEVRAVSLSSFAPKPEILGATQLSLLGGKEVEKKPMEKERKGGTEMAPRGSRVFFLQGLLGVNGLRDQKTDVFSIFSTTENL